MAVNKKFLVAAAAGLGVLLFATGAKAADGYDDMPPPPPNPEPGPDPIPPNPNPPKPAPSGKHPPNMSGDPAGYNTKMFPGAMAVRQWLINLGYGVLLNQDTLVKNAKVKTFQKAYNKVSAASPGANMGTLVVDGTAGKNTLNAIEVAFKMTETNKKSWNNIVKDS